MNSTDNAVPEDKPAKRDRMGKRKIAAMVMSKKDSTKMHVLKRLQEYFSKKEDAENRMKKLAKSLGVKITRLELK